MMFVGKELQSGYLLKSWYPPVDGELGRRSDKSNLRGSFHGRCRQAVHVLSCSLSTSQSFHHEGQPLLDGPQSPNCQPRFNSASTAVHGLTAPLLPKWGKSLEIARNYSSFFEGKVKITKICGDRRVLSSLLQRLKRHAPSCSPDNPPNWRCVCIDQLV